MRKMNFTMAIAISAVLALASCNSIEKIEEEPLPEPLTPVTENIPYITASLVPDVTRTAFSMPDGFTLTTVWSVDDRISVVPAIGYINYAGIYRIKEAGGGVGVFEQESPVKANSGTYGIFFPGDKLKSMIQFMNFTYTGQVQSKSDPMGHLSDYHVMYKTASSYSTIDFSDAEQSSCMMFVLSGMTFDHPSRITLMVQGGGKFYENNAHSSWYLSNPAEEYIGELSTSELALDLEGYGSESSIVAYMMMSSHDVQLSAGSTLRVKVQCADGEYYSDTQIASAVTLTGGYCHSLTVDGGWQKPSDFDAKVVTLQTATYGPGLDLVIVGDGFREEDIKSGEYDQLMREAYESFFSVQPLTYFRDCFNAYYVTAVSPNHFGATIYQNGATNNPDSTTLFNVTFTANATSVTGDAELVRFYASKAFESNAEARIKDATIIVLANESCRAGTCHQSYQYNSDDYGQGCAIAYCALGRNITERAQLVRHEACGHGFGKLGDEYTGSATTINTSLWTALDNSHAMGMMRNVDKFVDADLYSQLGGTYPLTTASNVYWHDLFGTANNYESPAVEALGVFKGAYTYSFGFCRPTEDGGKSIMCANTGNFNAPSRRTMFYRAMRLSGGITSNCYGTSTELASFLTWDAEVFLPTTRSSATRSHGILAADVLPGDTAPMVLHEGHWEGIRFVED